MASGSAVWSSKSIRELAAVVPASLLARQSELLGSGSGTPTRWRTSGVAQPRQMLLVSFFASPNSVAARNETRISSYVIWNGKRKPKGPDADEPCTASTLTSYGHPPHFLGTVLSPLLVRTAGAVILLPFSDETLKPHIVHTFARRINVSRGSVYF